MKNMLHKIKSVGLILGLSGSVLAQQNNPTIHQSMFNGSVTLNTSKDRGSISFCSYIQPGTFDQGYISMHDYYASPNYSADDINIPANTCMNLYQIISQHWFSTGVAPSSVNVHIWEDNAGIPGTLVFSQLSVPFSSTFLQNNGT